MGSVLEFYVALLLSVGGLIYRLASPHVDRAAFPILGLLVALALSTRAQALFSGWSWNRESCAIDYFL
jgi:hypothetical protein